MLKKKKKAAILINVWRGLENEAMWTEKAKLKIETFLFFFFFFSFFFNTQTHFVCFAQLKRVVLFQRNSDFQFTEYVSGPSASVA